MLSKDAELRVSTAHVLISGTCPNNCLFCATASKREAHRLPEGDAIDRFVREAARSGVTHLVFSGVGEPSADPRFEDYLQLAHGLGFRTIRLFTNGSGLTAEKATRWRSRGLSNVLLSVHGLKAGHDRNVQRDGAFRETMHALEVYTRLGYSVSLNTCLTRHNLDEIPALIAVVSDHPILRHALAFPEWAGNALRFSDSLLDYHEVSAVAETLIPPGDTTTFFDNLPCCIVGRPTTEADVRRPVAYLDGSGESELDPRHGQTLLPACRKRNCPQLERCPGFDKNYIASRGTEGIQQRVDDFLDSAVRGGARGRSQRRRAPTAAQSDQADADPLPATFLHRDRLTVVMLPTNRCNAGCAYCSSEKARAPRDMDLPLLKRLYRQLAEYARGASIRNIALLWHGGEPLMMGKEFYRTAWANGLDPRYFKIQHLIQTNLLALDEEWVQLLKRHDVRVGTSVDPLDDVRVHRDGTPQYGDWLRNFILACDRNLNVGVVLTVTAAHIGRTHEIYAFFKNLQLLSRRPVGLRINPVYPGGRAASESARPLTIRPQDYAAFLCELWDLWTTEGRTLPISPFRGWLGGGKPPCEFSGCCHDHFLGVDGDGGVYNCGRFADTASSFGNINESDLASIVGHPLRRRLFERNRRLQEGPCRDCSAWRFCRGGCPFLAVLNGGDPAGRSMFCEAYRVFFERCLSGQMEPLRGSYS